jgi:hypothetical protein
MISSVVEALIVGAAWGLLKTSPPPRWIPLQVSLAAVHIVEERS